MESVLFSFAQIVEKLPPKRNKRFSRNFADNFNDPRNLPYEDVHDLLQTSIGVDAMVSNITVKIDAHKCTGYYTSVWIAFSYAYSDSQLTTPWDVAQNEALSFLLCARHLGLHKDVAFLIAKQIYNNVSIKTFYDFIWKDAMRVAWFKTYWFVDQTFYFKPCINCKYPCSENYCEKCVNKKWTGCYFRLPKS